MKEIVAEEMHAHFKRNLDKRLKNGDGKPLYVATLAERLEVLKPLINRATRIDICESFIADIFSNPNIDFFVRQLLDQGGSVRVITFSDDIQKWRERFNHSHVLVCRASLGIPDRFIVNGNGDYFFRSDYRYEGAIGCFGDISGHNKLSKLFESLWEDNTRPAG